MWTYYFQGYNLHILYTSNILMIAKEEDIPGLTML